MCAESQDGGGYSLIEHIVRSIYFRDDWDEKELLMLTSLSSYFDRSEYPKLPHIVSVAGYLSYVTLWKDFDSEWKRFLQRPEYSVRYFHMKEFTVSQGEFAVGWKGERTKRKEFIAGLIEIIKHNTTASFAYAVRVHDFNAALASISIHPDCPLASPFAYCGWLCVERMSRTSLEVERRPDSS
ncbi:MAG TPA: hypothetical protein VIX19_10555 [Terriglobales bacterium]